MQVFSLLLPKNRLNGLLLGLSLFLAVPAWAQTESKSSENVGNQTPNDQPTRNWKSVEDFIYPQRLGKFDMALGLAYGGGLTPVNSSANSGFNTGSFSRMIGSAQIHGEYSILGSTVFRNPKYKLRVGDLFEFKIAGRKTFHSELPNNYADNLGFREVYWTEYLQFGLGSGFAIAYKTNTTDYLLKLKAHTDFEHLKSSFFGVGRTSIEVLITQKVWQYGFGFSLPVITNYAEAYRLDLGTTYLEAAKRLNTGQLIGLRLAYQHFSIQNRSGFSSNETYPVTNSVQATIFWRLQR